MVLESVLWRVPGVGPPAPGLVVVVSPSVFSVLASVLASPREPVARPLPRPLLGWSDGQGAASGKDEIGGISVVEQRVHGSDTAGREGDEAVSVDVHICSFVNDSDVLDVAVSGEVLGQILLIHLMGDAANVDPVLYDVVSGAAVI